MNFFFKKLTITKDNFGNQFEILESFHNADVRYHGPKLPKKKKKRAIARSHPSKNYY